MYTLAACTLGTFGAGCLQNCTCVPEQESSPCDIVDGACNCLPGYTGSACESGEQHEQFYDYYENARVNHASVYINTLHTCQYDGTECPEDFYGQDCLEECLCQNGAACDFITGMCNCTAGFTGALCTMSESDA